MPLEYWEACDSRQGGLLDDISENALCIRSPEDMRIGAELRIRIFFSLGHEFDGFQVSAVITGKDVCCEGGWEIYEYVLEIVEISEQDRLKLRNLLRLRQLKQIYS